MVATCAERPADAADATARPVLFERLEPSPPRHPRSSYPMLPVLGRRVAAASPAPVASRFLGEDALFTTSGGAAIRCALRDAGVGEGDQVLVPAYHCPSMVWPVLAARAAPVFVPLREDLGIGTAQLELCAGARTRALLLPHYFGVVQTELREIRGWCERRGVVLIEDCAHAFYAVRPGELPGSVGDYAIASTRKFFPGVEGGALVANGRALRTALRPASLAEELRCLRRTFGLAHEYGGLPWQRSVRPLAGTHLEGARDEAGAIAESMPAPASDAELGGVGARRQACRLTRWLVRHEPHALSAGIRRARWQRWREVVDGVPGVDAFVDALPQHVVPHVFAAVLHDPGRIYRQLKYAGVQVWRWDRLAVSDCPTSRALALRLIQLPCQQALGDEAFERLLRAFADVLRARSR